MKNKTSKTKIAIFEGKTIRRHWDEKSEVVTKCDQLKMHESGERLRPPRFRTVESHNAEHNQNGDHGYYIKSYSIHMRYSLLRIATTKIMVTTAPIIRYAIINWFIKIYLASLTLAHRVIVAIIEPNKKAVNVIGPVPVGIKKPITAEATKILDRSAKYPDSVYSWFWFNRMP